MSERSLKTKLDNLLSESNKIAKEIGIKIKSGDNDIGDLKHQSAKLKEDSKKIDKELKLTEESIKSILVNIPNVPDNKVPKGNSEDQNIEISKHEIPINNVEKLKPHWDLIKEFNLIDFDNGNKITGAKMNTKKQHFQRGGI